MSVQTDLAYAQRELRAMKAYAKPMLDLLIQRDITIQPTDNPPTLHAILQFVDNLQHMVWMIPGGCDEAAIDQLTGAGLIVWSIRVHPGYTGELVFSSFSDFTVSLS